MHAKETLALARILEHFQAAMRTSWRFKWRYAEEWFAENQPWSPNSFLGNFSPRQI